MSYVNDTSDFMRVASNSKFSTVLKVKKIQERKAQSELHQLQVAHSQEQATLDEIEETRDSALSDAVRSMRIKATDAQTNRAFIRKLSREMDEQTKKVENLELREAEKRGEVVERSKSTSMIEKLDERVRTEETKEGERKEQRLIDVLAQRIRPDKT